MSVKQKRDWKVVMVTVDSWEPKTSKNGKEYISLDCGSRTYSVWEEHDKEFIESHTIEDMDVWMRVSKSEAGGKTYWNAKDLSFTQFSDQAKPEIKPASESLDSKKTEDYDTKMIEEEKRKKALTDEEFIEKSEEKLKRLEAIEAGKKKMHDEQIDTMNKLIKAMSELQGWIESLNKTVSSKVVEVINKSNTDKSFNEKVRETKKGTNHNICFGEYGTKKGCESCTESELCSKELAKADLAKAVAKAEG